MKIRFLKATVFSMISILLSCSVFALEGEPYMHDPSTIMLCNGKYYAYGTGGSGLVSDDGWTWRSSNRLPQSGAAPDAIRIGDRYLIAIGATGGGLGGGHNGRIVTFWNKTLDPQSPDYKFSEAVEVASSDGIEDCDAIDPGLCLAPDGRLWCTYGTFFGFTRIVELDPKTGKRVEGNVPVDIAIDCEATDLIYRDGWYYLLGDHGTCCNNVTSTYNIRVGRSKNPTGPFLDNMGMDMLKGGGKLVIAANNRKIGPGHFGLIDLGNDVQKFSYHYEADMDDPGHFGVLDIRTLLWKNGWPVAGDEFLGGNFQILSEATGYSLELGVDAVPHSGGGRGGMGMGMGRGTRGGAGATRGGRGDTGTRGGEQGGAPAGRGGVPGAGNFAGAIGGGERGADAGGRGGAGAARGGMGMFGGAAGGSSAPIADQNVVDVSKTWPDRNLDARLGDYMIQAHQKWTITPVKDAGGYLGSPYFKITITGTERALAATENSEVMVVPAFNGQPNQLWRIDQMIDGCYRIMPKSSPDYALTAVGVSTPSLVKFESKTDKARWNFIKP
jgi:arabinan endo-1,5-alpha-L-arabinosidase